MNRVQLVITVDSGAIGAAPGHVSREMAIADAGIALVSFLLKFADKRSYRRVDIELCFDASQGWSVVVIGRRVRHGIPFTLIVGAFGSCIEVQK